jgi:hypothetical protein
MPRTATFRAGTPTWRSIPRYWRGLGCQTQPTCQPSDFEPRSTPSRDLTWGIPVYYSWSKEFLEAGKKRLAGDTAREASTGEVKDLRREARDLKEVVAEQALEIRLLKKSMTGDGGELE